MKFTISLFRDLITQPVLIAAIHWVPTISLFSMGISVG
jgi:hypothetical protein